MHIPNIPIAFWFGTEAEVIKSFPIILALREKGLFPSIIATGQNNLLKSSIITEYHIEPNITLNQFNGRKLPRNVIIWYLWTFINRFGKAIRYIRTNNIKYIIVHGDTLSTLMGAIIGRIAGAEIWHLEAGLRTFRWFTPFPEEIDRYITGKIARVHFCQNEEAMKNVALHAGEKIFTQGNVIYDVVDMYVKRGSDILERIPKSFSVITFHRAESLYLGNNFQICIDTLFQSASQIATIFVMFEATREMIEKIPGLMEKIETHPNIIIQPRLQYSDFCVLMKEAKYIITDGGSNQEELAHIGTPTLIMRTATERVDGIGKNIILSHLQKEKINDFLKNYKKYDYKGEDQGKPTEIVTNYIIQKLQS